jgi:hypothetical protein
MKDLKISKENLMTTIEYTELGIYLQKNMNNLAAYLLNRCYVVFHKNKILGVYPKWDYTVESITDIFKNEPFKDEIRITMFYKVINDRKDNK